MALNLTPPDISELKPRITVFGVGGAGGNAVNNMITAGLQGVDFVVANTDAQALTMSKAQRIIQMGTQVTQGLGAGSQPDVGAAAAQEVLDEIRDHLSGANMVFVTAGMGGGTGTGAAPVIAKTARFHQHPRPTAGANPRARDREATMALNLTPPDIHELKPRITVFGVGGAGGNAVNNMITAGLQGVDFVVANTDAQALTMSKAQRIIQMGTAVTQGLGAGSQPDVGAAAAQEVIDEIRDHLSGANMVFVTAGMGGGTGTGALPSSPRPRATWASSPSASSPSRSTSKASAACAPPKSGIAELHKVVDTLLIIPNQNLFRVANEKTTFADAFAMADQVLYSGVACITDLMVKEGLINLDFADVRAVMREMGKAMMGTGEASGDKRALTAAEAAIANPLIDDSSMKGARGLLISITGGKDLTLFEVDEAATRIREEVDQDANIIVGATFDESLDGIIRVSVVATGIEQALISRNAAHAGRAATPRRHPRRRAGKSPGRSDRAAARRQ